jgi:hypothetical protein
VVVVGTAAAASAVALVTLVTALRPWPGQVVLGLVVKRA